MHLGFLQRLDVFSRGTEMSHLELICQLPQADGRRLEWTAVPEDDGRTHTEAGHQPVPHHPARGGIVKEDVLGIHVAVDDVFLLQLEQETSARMDNAFGQARGA